MSQENVEASRGVIEAINERGPDAVLDLLDPEVEFLISRMRAYLDHGEALRAAGLGD
jgi:hypothetical protein